MSSHHNFFYSPEELARRLSSDSLEKHIRLEAKLLQELHEKAEKLLGSSGLELPDDVV
jgi:hypothetical protein